MPVDRRDRQLRWVTLNQQRFPKEQAADWLDAIRQGLCPICGGGPFIVPAMHVSLRHDIDRFELRDMLGLPVQTSICDPTHSKSAAERGKRQAAGRDMREVGRSHGGPRRRTVADAVAKDRSRKPKSCTWCGKPSGRQQTCSDACRHARMSASTKAVRAAETRTVTMLSFTCPECGQDCEKPASQVRSNRKQGWDGPFCGMSCAGKYRQRKRRAAARLESPTDARRRRP